MLTKLVNNLTRINYTYLILFIRIWISLNETFDNLSKQKDNMQTHQNLITLIPCQDDSFMYCLLNPDAFDEEKIKQKRFIVSINLNR